MENFDLTIPGSSSKEDFTIVYKGRKSFDDDKEQIIEINTFKSKLIKKLRHFKNKENEINLTKEILIHDSITCDSFQKFIASIFTKKIQINEANYAEFYELSSKYGYEELQHEIEIFIQNRPDLKKIINHLSSKEDDPNKSEDTSSESHNIDEIKEEIIAKNLDICLNNGFLNQIPLSVLIRILNSPKRILKDHHKLFQFVIETMNKYSKEQNDFDYENLQILPSCLNYMEMSSDEIEQLMLNESVITIFNPSNSKEGLKTIIQSNQSIQNKNKELELKINDLYIKINENNKRYESLVDEVLQKYQQQSAIIENLQQNIKQNEQKIQEMKDEIQQLKTSNESIQKNQNELKIQNENIQKQIQVKDDEIDNYGKIHDELNIIKKMIVNTPICIPFQKNHEFQGIIRYLQSKSNGNIESEINITSSSTNGDFYPQNAVNFDDPNKVFFSNDLPDQWLCFEFKNCSILPVSYTLRKCNKYIYPAGWILEASNDNKNWETIDCQDNISLTDNLNFQTFDITNKKFTKFRFIRFRLTKTSSSSLRHLIIDALELYGVIYPSD